MPVCPTCGSRVADAAVFCSACGASLTTSCTSCGTQVAVFARFCAACGASVNARSPSLEEERKVVTILFADVTGSTSLGDQLDPERLRSLLRQYFSTTSAVIESWGGTVEKFIGDAVMAAFGVPSAREDDPERAIRAALDVLERLEDLNRTFESHHGVTLRVRIGINTGEVIAPTSDVVDQFMASGDAVNVAARLEQAADPGSIVVGERTYFSTRNAFRFMGPVNVQLRGKRDAEPAWRVIEALPEASRGIPGLHSPMVGRDRELETLSTMLDETLEGDRPRMITVFGPAGIGKSRLVREFVHDATSRHAGLSMLSGRCLAAGHGITYWALAEILRELAGIRLADPADMAATKLRRRVRDLLAPLGLDDAEVERTVFALAITAGITMADNPLATMEPRRVADELALAWPRLATACAARGPTVVLVEDLHWAEQQLLDMLERLVARSSGPLLFVATARPEFADDHSEFVSGREEASSISLRPLTEQQSDQLVSQLLASAELPESLREEMLSKAEGNPFFLEEIIRRLIDERALVHERDRWLAGSTAGGIVLPDTVHALLAARIDALPREEKRVLQEASVVGRVFWEEPVARALGNGAVGDALLRLERRGLVFARPVSTIAGQSEFAFKHALVRDVAYASLPKTRRARAHAEQARWIEELAAERTDEFAELIADHYYAAVAAGEADLAWVENPSARADVRRRAFEALLRAGLLARKRFAIAKALDLHKQALEVSSSGSERARALEEQADDHVAAYHGDEAVAAFEEALEILRRTPGGEDERARLCAKAVRAIAERSGTFRTHPSPQFVEDLLNEGLSVARDPGWRAWLLALSGVVASYWDMMRMGPRDAISSRGARDPVPSARRIAMTKEGLALAETLRNDELVSMAARALSDLYVSQGLYAEALEASRKQLAVVDTIDAPGERAVVLFELSQTMIDLAGDLEEGLELGRRSHEVAKTLSAHELMHATFTQMDALYWLGRWGAIGPLLSEHLSVYDQEANVTCMAVRNGPLVGALVDAHRGNAERARALADLARGDPDGRRLTLECNYALVLALTGDRAEAVAVVERARETFGEPWYRPMLAIIEVLLVTGDGDRLAPRVAEARRFDAIPLMRAASDRAEALVAGRTDPERARDLLRSSLREFERLAMPFEAARTREMLAPLTAPVESRSLLRRVLIEYESLGASLHARRVRTTMAAPPREAPEPRR